MIKHIKWLLPEVDRWVQDGIIDLPQAMSIKSRYPTPEQPVSWGRIIFLSLGAILFGLGVILLFAYNWERLHKFVKLAVIAISLGTAHGLGFWFRRRDGKHRAVGEGLYLLGTMLFGAGIWLIAQIYHIDEHFTNAFFVWGIGALALGWAVPSIPHGVIAAIILVFWNGLEVFSFAQANHFASFLIMAGIMPLAWLLRSRALVGTGISLFLTALSFTCSRVDEDLVIPVLFFSISGLIAVSLIVCKNKSFPESAPIFSFLGYLPYFAILYLMSFPGAVENLLQVHFEQTASALYFSMFSAVALLLWVAAIWSLRKIGYQLSLAFRMDRLGVLAALIIMILLIVSGLVRAGGWIFAGLFNLPFLFHGMTWTARCTRPWLKVPMVWLNYCMPRMKNRRSDCTSGDASPVAGGHALSTGHCR